jgi:hypothetical protein
MDRSFSIINSLLEVLAIQIGLGQRYGQRMTRHNTQETPLSADHYVPRKDTVRVWRKFTLSRTAELKAMVGGKPNVAQRIVIERAVRGEWSLVRMDFAIERGETLSREQLSHRAALERQLRSDLSLLAMSEAA